MGKRSRNRSRSERQKKPEFGLSPAVTDETTGDPQGGGRRNPHVRAECREIRKHLRAGVFDDDELDAMTKRMGQIVMKGNHREAIAAYKTLLARAKLSADLETHQPELHNHLHLEGHATGVGVFEIATELGLSIDLVPDGGQTIDSVGPSQRLAEGEESQ